MIGACLWACACHDTEGEALSTRAIKIEPPIQYNSIPPWYNDLCLEVSLRLGIQIPYTNQDLPL